MRIRNLFALGALVACATPVEAQYRRQIEELEPIWAVTASVGALFPYQETITPVETPEPEENRRGRRDVDASPWVSLSGRYGRGLAIYASIGAAFAGDAELLGNDPLTGVALEGTADVGLISIVSAGMSFTPLKSVSGLRLELGPSWIDLGDGGSYVAVRVSAAAKFLEIGDRGGAFVAWDGLFAGGQYDRDGVEYQIRSGMVTGLRAGYELAW